MKRLNKKVGSYKNSVIMHVDMDCFFASVSTRSNPALANKPIAIAHTMGVSQTHDSTSEIACVNYAARKFGIKNGCFLGQAKTVCPDLIVLPYEFESLQYYLTL
jgi:DNA repair protein REV1